MVSNPDTLVLVAAGNSGANGNYTVFSPALSKNGLSVGSSQSLRNSGYDISAVSYFSSQGPSADGRIKPDFVAPGQKLYSANAGSTCGVIDKMGKIRIISLGCKSVRL